MNALLPGLLLKLAVHTGQSLAAHVLPENNRVGPELLAELPELVQQNPVAAVSPISHDHILGQPRHIVDGLLLVILGQHPGGHHGQHIRQRQDAPAVLQPDQEIKVEMGLHAPDDGPVAVLRQDLMLRLVSLLRQRRNLPVCLQEVRILAADGHVIGLCIQRQVGAEHLGVIGLIHFQPLQTMAGGLIYTPGTGEISVPVPFLPGLLFNELDTVPDFLGRVFLHVLLLMAEGRCQLKAGHAVLQLQPLGNDAVAHE